MNFGSKIDSLRQEKGLSQAELGERLGYSQRTISDWENGKTEPNLSATKRIARLFDITFEELFESIDE